jgi:DNA-directed RNA polymerase specialized sigma24 family protein
MMKHRPPAGAMPGRDLSAVMERMRPALMAFFVRRLSDPVQAEDLIQDLFIRMATMRGPATDNPEGYIFQAAANLLRDQYRRDC